MRYMPAEISAVHHMARHRFIKAEEMHSLQRSDLSIIYTEACQTTSCWLHIPWQLLSAGDGNTMAAVAFTYWNPPKVLQVKTKFDFRFASAKTVATTIAFKAHFDMKPVHQLLKFRKSCLRNRNRTKALILKRTTVILPCLL
jgi:hypothetical protein